MASDGSEYFADNYFSNNYWNANYWFDEAPGVGIGKDIPTIPTFTTVPDIARKINVYFSVILRRFSYARGIHTRPHSVCARKT